jgi:hypothetical protein
MAVLITPDGEAKTVLPKNGTDFTNDEIHELVGGYWQTTLPAPGMLLLGSGDNVVVMELVRGSLMVVNEEGKLIGMPVNPVATSLLLDLGDYIVGPALLCGPEEIV